MGFSPDRPFPYILCFENEKVKSLSSVRLFGTPWTVAYQALSSMEFAGLKFIKCTIALSLGEGNGNPLQCSCMENPRDGGA